MEIDYIIKKSRRRSISVSVTAQGKVFVKAPYGAPTSYIEEYLYSKKDWILKTLAKVEKQNDQAQALGPISQEDLKEIKKQAKKLIPQRVEYYAGLAGITYNKIAIRLQKSRWGSCSADGNLNFNCLLVLMPLQVLDSVVVHELVHRHHMNHSKAFYDEVLRLYPEYKKWDKWLKQNGPAYMLRIDSLVQ
ncbi:MAG: M48 family metallopeptidase [Treponema sp.]|nr:M48 family metallopeptidase [Treponema sp.]